MLKQKKPTTQKTPPLTFSKIKLKNLLKAWADNTSFRKKFYHPGTTPDVYLKDLESGHLIDRRNITTADASGALFTPL